MVNLTQSQLLDSIEEAVEMNKQMLGDSSFDIETLIVKEKDKTTVIQV